MKLKLEYLKKTLKTCLKYYKKKGDEEKIKELEYRIANLDKK